MASLAVNGLTYGYFNIQRWDKDHWTQHEMVIPIMYKFLKTEESCHKMMLYKIIHRLVELPLPDYIIPAQWITRGNSLEFVHPATSADPYN